jgi:hypothetical protein
MIEDQSGGSAAATRPRGLALTFGAHGEDGVGHTEDDATLASSFDDDVTPRRPGDAESFEGVSSMHLKRADSHLGHPRKLAV